jgi:hypothetical protein
MHNASRLKQSTWEGRLYLAEIAARTIALKIRARKVFSSNKAGEKIYKAYMEVGFNEFVCLEKGQTIKTQSSGLPGKYINVLSLPFHILEKVKNLSMCNYAHGKLLAYVGSYDYPSEKGYSYEEITENELSYFVKVYC